SSCVLGGQQGDILLPSLTVTVNTSGTYGASHDISGLSPSDAAISYSPSSEAANVTGSLSCSTDASAASPASGSPYHVSLCSGLPDPGYNVVYDYGDSTVAVTKATPVLTWATPADITYGTPLSGTQLDASANGVAGSFAYNPSAGVVLDATQSH